MIDDLAATIVDRAPRTRLVLPASGDDIETGRLIDAGIDLMRATDRSSTVAALLTNDQASVEVLLGAIVAGGRLVSVPLPGRAADVDAYARMVRDVVDMQGAEVVVARDDVAALLTSLGLPAIPHSDLDPSRPIASHGPGFELVQFTSGTTGPPKALTVDGTTLARNICAMLERIAPGSGDVTVSWLPLAHDMGLIGMVLSSLCAMDHQWAAGGSVVLLEPERFLRSPRSWLDAIEQWRGTITAAPDFGYRMAAERRGGTADLSSLRHAIVGGEIVRPATLHEFEAAFAADGFGPLVLAPAYGMAELGLGATMTPPGERWRAAEVALASVVPGSSARHITMASSGPPLAGYAVAVEPGSHRLAISRPAPGGANSIRSEPLLTNDVGFVDADGWVYVTGRTDDTIVANARNLFAPDVEQAVSSVDGVRSGRSIAFGTPDGGWVIAAERDPRAPGDEKAILAAARRAAIASCGVGPDALVLLGPGTLPMTASGKPQRSETLARWVDGRLGSRSGTSETGDP